MSRTCYFLLGQDSTADANVHHIRQVAGCEGNFVMSVGLFQDIFEGNALEQGP